MIERIQERWIIRHVFDNAQDAASVANSFRDIVILMNVFEVSGCGGCGEMISLLMCARWIPGSTLKPKQRKYYKGSRMKKSYVS